MLVQRQLRIERCVFTGVADTDNKFAGIDGPLVNRRVPGAEGAGVEVDGHVLSLAGRQPYLLKALQFALRAADPCRGIGDVELGYFCSGNTSGIGYVEVDRDT